VLGVFVCAELAFFPPFSQFLLLLLLLQLRLLPGFFCFFCFSQSMGAAANGRAASRWSLKKDKKFPQRKKQKLGASGGWLGLFATFFYTKPSRL